MRKMFKKPHDIMLYKERTEFQEFGKAKKNFRLCRVCGCVYFNKSWHHPEALTGGKAKKPSARRLTVCPACQMIKDHQYEGILTVKDVPHQFRLEFKRLIKAFTDRAYQMDCQHRLIAENKHNGGKWVITFTENQLANKLAKKIKDVFDKVTVTTAYSQQPDDVERITANFNPLLLNPT